MLIHGYFPRIGGAERQVRSVIPFLRERNIQVSVVTRQFDDTPAYEEIDEVPVYRMPIPGPKAVASLTYTLASIRTLGKLKPDLIHAHEFISPLTTALIAKRRYGYPIVVTPHRSGYLGDVQRLERRRLSEKRREYIKNHVDGFVVISHEIDDELAGMGIEKERRHLIPNGVDADQYVPVSPDGKKKLRQELGLPDGPILVFMGRLAPEKRVNLLVEIWQQVRESFPDATLLILGAGPEEENLRAAAGEGVNLWGGVDDVIPFLQASDVFVLPSVAEGFSVAILEALSCGVPVIASRVGGATDVIQHQKNGWIVEPDDKTQLLEAVLALFGDDSLRHELSQAGRQTIMETYHLSAIADVQRKLFEKVLDL